MAEKKQNLVEKPIKYLKESKTELKKVTWPTTKEAVNLTIVVLVISAVVALFLGLYDFILNYGMSILLKK